MHAGTPRVTKSEKDEQARWRAEDDLRTLTTAQTIKGDKPRHKRALDLAKEQMAALGKVSEA